jgi:DUF1365 family protein
MTAGALYAGTIRHRRFAVVEREFRHPIALAYVDLDELPADLRLVQFRRSDYLAPDAVRAQAGTDGPVRMLGLPRSLGRCFNPVCVYYCFDARDERLEAVVAEVTNTPWGERHAYVLPRRGDGAVLHGSSAKALHVSPFLDMGSTYEWRATEPGETLSVHISAGDAFDATLSLRRRPLTRRGLVAASWRVSALIYAHAARLKLAGVPVHAHPAAA